MKELTDYEKERRLNNENYFSNGKPKKGSMMCRDKSYLAEIKRINGGYIDIGWVCAGNRCPLYRMGCDDRGRDWNE